LGGAIVNLVMAPKGPGSWVLGLGKHASTIVVLAAVAPDIDFAWGGHNRETHSLGAAIIAGLVVLAWKRSPRLAIAVTLSWATHVLFDWLGSDDTPPLGVMALWPLNSNFYFADAYLFEAISRRYWLDNFFTHNAWAVLKEILILGPIAFIAFQWRARRRSRRPGKG
jgi:LexA-binding, inner membrane-associated putative hydrolase